MRFLFLFINVLFVYKLHAQDLTGTWEGNSSPMGADYVKLVIVKTGDHYYGYTYDEGMGYCKANFIGRFDEQSKKFKGRGDGMIEKTFWHTQCVYNLRFSTDGKEDFLKGLIWPRFLAVKVLSLGIPMSISLRRIKSTFDTTAYMQKHLDAVKIPIEEKEDTALSFMAEFDKIEEKILQVKQERLADTVQSITITTRKINFKIFDNGISDGDSVSILYNDRLLIPALVVAAKPYEIEMDLQPGVNVHTITLVAHNLGTIPPNTATVIIESGDKKFRLSASSDFKKNAVIVIHN